MIILVTNEDQRSQYDFNSISFVRGMATPSIIYKSIVIIEKHENLINSNGQITPENLLDAAKNCR